MDKQRMRDRCIEILDGLVDKGVDITKLSQELPRNEYNAIRNRISRSFGSQEEALKAFGLFDVNAVPTNLELTRCFDISDKYEVIVNEYERSFICDIYNLDDKQFERLTTSIFYETKKDALDEFYRNEFPNKIKTSIIINEFPHIWNYIRIIYGNIGNFMKDYGTPSHIFVDYNYDRYNGEAIKNGHTFEGIVSDILLAIFSDIKMQVVIEECRPDFIIGNAWYDAKLTLGTVFHHRKTTLSRYLKYTNDLTFIYAKGKCRTFESDGAKFVHISEYYPELEKVGRRDLIERCETFLEHLDDKESEPDEKEAVN